MSSSHFATAERQYRFPPGLRWPAHAHRPVDRHRGGLRASGAAGGKCGTQRRHHGHRGGFRHQGRGQHGRGHAPAAYHTIRAHFDDLHLSPNDFDLLVTGDLGALGKEILLDLFRRTGVGIGGVYDDCGTMIYDLQKQDVHAGGSGCGCGSVVLCGYLMNRLLKGKLRTSSSAAPGRSSLPSPPSRESPFPGSATLYPWAREEVGMELLKAFLVGGLLCALGQILIDKTKLTPARILVLYVVAGRGAGRCRRIREIGGLRRRRRHHSPSRASAIPWPRA